MRFTTAGTPDSTDIVAVLDGAPQRGRESPSPLQHHRTATCLHVAEPLDVGYSKSGDATGVGGEYVARTCLVDYMSLTRVLSVLEPEYEGAVLEVVLRRFDGAAEPRNHRGRHGRTRHCQTDCTDWQTLRAARAI